jgi:hypothetical protein
MNLKKIAAGSALALALTMGLMVFGGRRAQAAGTWYVSTTGVATGVSGGSCSNPSFNTIGTAVAAAANGDTIQVCAGTYPESFGVNTGLVINGPNAGISPNGGTRVAEAIISSIGNPTIRISTIAPVTIAGFTFTGATGANIDSYTPGNNPTIKKNVFTAGTDGFFFNTPALFTFEDNYLHDLTDCGSCEGVFIAGNWNGTTGTVASIKDNVWSTLGGPATNLSDISGTISGNRFSYVSYYCLLLANGSNVDVCGNTFDHTINPNPNPLTNGSATWGAGVRFYNPSFGFGARITGNTFTTNYVGIGVRPANDITGLDVYAHNNNFVGNTSAGIRHLGLGTFNATNDWWNSASGPTNAGNPGGHGDVIDGSGPVNFTPWLTAASTVGCFSVASNKNQCKDGGWMTYRRANGTAFKNQGDCVSYTVNGK